MKIKSMKNVDIIIPTFNRGSFLHKTLSSILQQTIDFKSINVIVVDDGSTDDTFEIVKDFEKKLNLKYIYQEDNGYRVVSARNIGINIGNSEICLFIDSGVLLESTCIEKHFKFHKRYKDPIALIGYCHGYVQKETDLKQLEDIIIEIEDIDKIIYYIENNKIFLDVREKEFIRFNYAIDQLPAPWAYFWGGHLSINRNCFIKGEYFDTIFEPRYGYEDIDLGYRLHHEGIKIFLNYEAKALHFPHPKIINCSNDLKKNSELFYQKHMSKLTRLFVKNGGTMGFNESLIESTISY
jgi:glycosyltransferase involved in cell wall biosynthesis